jgi:hypothetical protein
LLRPFTLTAFALFAISFSGCLISGVPCEPGDWHYQSGCCRRASYCTECQNCATRPLCEELDDANCWRQRPVYASGNSATANRVCRAERIRPCPDPDFEAEGNQVQPYQAGASQVAQLRRRDQSDPRMSVKTQTRPGTAEEADDNAVQNCDWQQPENVPAKTSPADSAKPAPQHRPAAGNRSPQSVTAASTDSNIQEPFAWGYFGASTRW